MKGPVSVQSTGSEWGVGGGGAASRLREKGTVTVWRLENYIYFAAEELACDSKGRK